MAMTGTIKFFNGERGYGFIKPDDGGRDVFVHITAVEHAGLKASSEALRGDTFAVSSHTGCRRFFAVGFDPVSKITAPYSSPTGRKVLSRNGSYCPLLADR